MTAAHRLPGPAELDRLLADRALELCADLLPGGHREGHEWRCGSIAGEMGGSLGVHLAGAKCGVWADFASGEGGKLLDLIQATQRLGLKAAIKWARQWLGIVDGSPISRPAVPKKPETAQADDPDRWRFAWRPAQPIAGTLAETYLTARHLNFKDPDGRVLRFCPRRARNNPAGELDHHPALLIALCDIRSGEGCGVINVYLLADGSDRIRDRKGKTVTGRAKGAAAMLSAFDEPTMGLTICEGIETGIAILMSGLAPVWALGGAGNLGAFPVAGGIECLTIAADVGEAGQAAAEKTAKRWHQAGRKVTIVTPPADDWAARR
jgi:Toprim domain